MRKLLLLTLAAACLAFAGCSSDDDKDDNTIRYDEAKGYLTNLASAKHGIVGRWSAGTAHYSYNADGTSCSGTFGQEVLPYCLHTYDIQEKNGIFFLQSKQISPEYYGPAVEIITLTKEYFRYTNKDGTIARFVRVSEEPTP